MKDEYDFVGHKRMLIDFDGGSPEARCVIPADADHEKIVAAIDSDIRAAFAKHCLFVRFSADVLDKPLISLTFHSRPEIIKTRDEENAAWSENTKALGVIFRKSHDDRIASFDRNPNNGKHGYWHVSGVRHDAYVLASSEKEAVEKAAAESLVSDWESPTARFVGERPEAMG